MAMPAAERKIRWGVLGYARIAREMVMPAIVRSANSTLHALASRDAAKLADARTRFALPQSYATYDELLRSPEVDAVYVPLPNSLHREWTIKAAEQGKHVLCEKPLALTAAEAREMMTACERNGVRLMEAFMYRYTARTQAVLEVIRRGTLGEIRQINSTFRFLLARPDSIKLRPELGGGALYDVGCYPINFIGLVMDTLARGAPGSWAQPESAVVASVREGGVDVSFSALLRYAGGVLATVNCGFNAHKHVSAEIIGTQGVLSVPDTYFDPAGSLTLTVGEERTEIPVPASDRYRLEVEDFAAAILEQRPPRLSLDESLRNAALMDRLRAAEHRAG